MENDPIKPIDKILETLITEAPEEKLSNTVYVTHPKTDNPNEVFDEFIPKKNIRHNDGPSVEYINEKGEIVVEIIDKDGGKFEILDAQPHVPGKKEHPHQHLKNQPEFDLE